MTAAVAAYEIPLTPQLITEAVTIGQSGSDATRRAFNAAYRMDINAAPVDYLEIVTPFRRVVMEAQLRGRSGQRRLTQREGLALAAEAGQALEIYLELTFHPLNNFVGVPGIEITLIDVTRNDDAVILPSRIRRVPRFGPRLQDSPLPLPSALPGVAGSQPLTGGTVVAAFEPPAIRPDGQYEIVVSEDGKDLARQRVNLAGLR